MDSPDLKSIAIHEAGHAVSAILLGVKFSKATIIPNGDMLGAVSFRVKTNLTDALNTGELTPRIERVIKNHLIISMAGPLAESKYKKEYKREHLSNDYEMCVDIIGNFFGNMRVANAYMNYIIEETKALVSSKLNWLRIERITDELLNKHELSYRTCYRICYPELVPRN